MWKIRGQLAHSTLLDWIAKTCTLLHPLYEKLKQEVLQALLSNYKGYLQSDGYTSYETLAENKDITLLCCMAQARRYFLEAEKNDPKRVAYALNVFAQLYDIEREIKDKPIRGRKEARQELFKPIWGHFGQWLEENAGILNERNAIHKAFAYTMKRFKRLAVYMENGMLNIDNNPIESSIWPVALGRKNYMFSGSHDGAQRSAMLYSFMGTCKLHGINPMIWMVDVLK